MNNPFPPSPPQEQTPAPTVPCLDLQQQRNLYYTGKFLTPDDFRVEQDYNRSHRHLQNRLLHGWGLICGLEVKHHRDWDFKKDTNCAKHKVEVTSGAALDSCGRELVSEMPTRSPAFLLHTTWSHPDPDAVLQEGGSQDNGPCNPEIELLDGPRLLCLKYAEVDEDFATPLCEDPPVDQHNRRRETTEIVLLSTLETQEVSSWYWPTQCKELKDPGCVYPSQEACPDHLTPLAMLHPYTEDEYETQGQSGPVYRIDASLRRYVHRHRPRTRIVGATWKTNGATLAFPRDLEGTTDDIVPLRVECEHPLCKSNFEAVGEMVFRMWCYQPGDEQWIPLRRAASKKPYVNPDHCCELVLPIERRHLESLLGSKRRFRVELDCDFVKNELGVCVDGNLLGGDFPTGNGVEGGTFISWFDIEQETPQD